MGTCGCIDGVKKELGKVTDALGKACGRRQQNRAEVTGCGMGDSIA
jgi:hypothetical protein